MKENVHLIRYKYEVGVYTLKYVFILVETNQITKEEFHMITGFDYDGIKKNRGW